MKKIFFTFLLLIIIFSCKKNNSKEIQAQNVTKSEENLLKDESKKVKVTFIQLGSEKCMPCVMMKPILKKVEEIYKDQVKVIFYDVWTEKDSAMAYKYKIKVIPTQIFLDQNGNEYFRHEGYFPFEEIQKILNIQGVY